MAGIPFDFKGPRAIGSRVKQVPGGYVSPDCIMWAAQLWILCLSSATGCQHENIQVAM